MPTPRLPSRIAQGRGSIRSTDEGEPQMLRLERRLMIAALGLTPILAGWAAIARLNLQPDSQLWVEGTSTVRDFKCSARTIDASIATTRTDAAAAVYAGEKAVTTVTLQIPAAQLDCKNGQMN